MGKIKIQWMVKVAATAAVAVVLMLFEFPLPFLAPPFYELDLSEVPVLVGTFALGPLAGVTIELLKIVINLLINGTQTACVGEFANFLIGVAFVIPAELIYRRKKCKKNAVLGMVLGGLTMIIIAGLLNAFVLIPVYSKAFKIPTETIVEMGRAIHTSIDSLAKLVLLCVVPFNAIKVVLVSVITAVIYKPLSPILKVRAR